MILKQERSYNFAEELNKTEKILVILPAGDEYSEPMQNFVRKIGKIFEKARVSTFVKSSLRKNDLSWLGVPNDHYLKVIQDEQFDLVVDVNLRQDKISSYLCALSGAPMRVNLVSGKFDDLYNLHFRVNDNKSLEERMQNILSYLDFLCNKNLNKA